MSKKDKGNVKFPQRDGEIRERILNERKIESKNEIKDKPIAPMIFEALPQNNSFYRDPETNDKRPSDYAVKEAKDWADFNTK